MKPLCRHVPFVALMGLVLVAAGARADEETIPSFKTSTKRETEEFITKVGTTIIKAARTKPQKIELKNHEYKNPKPGRKELVMKMNYTGLVSRKKYDVDITVLIDVDTADKEKWEVVNIKFKDTNPAPLGPSDKAIQKLIKEFNK